MMKIKSAKPKIKPTKPKLTPTKPNISLDADLINTKVFHAGAHVRDGNTVTAGGRVLSVTSLGDTLASAKKNVYQQMNKIQWNNCRYRHDIGEKGLKSDVPA